MSQAQVAAGLDRLPWLTDENPQAKAAPKKRVGNRETVVWAVAAALLVAAVSYWMGAHSWEPSAPSSSTSHSLTVPVPQPRPNEQAQQQPQVTIAPQPQVSPTPLREVNIPRPRAERRSGLRRAGPLKRESPSTSEIEKVIVEQKATPAKPQPATKPVEKPLTVWPATQSQGAAGRLVRIGAFGTREQAKLGWRHMVQAYPAVAHLNATVVSDRNSRGRHFYRFQIGTTSQAHSEVLCQRMEKIKFSCAVVGLPWKPKGVER
jgi:hypothetical protein